VFSVRWITTSIGFKKGHLKKVPNKKGEYPINIFDPSGDFFLPKHPLMFSEAD